MGNQGQAITSNASLVLSATSSYCRLFATLVIVVGGGHKLFRLWSRQHTTQLLLKHALSTDFYIGIRIFAQLCRQASISNAAPFLRSVGPMVRYDASPHSRDCGEDSFMAQVGCRVSLLCGGARGSGV